MSGLKAMSDKIEKIAFVLAQISYGVLWDNAPNQIQEQCRVDARAVLEALRPELEDAERMRKGLEAANALMNESYGVSGLHLNGDVAPWSELRTGGRFEEWLIEFDDALESNHGPG